MRKLILVGTLFFFSSALFAQHWATVKSDNSKTFFEKQEAFYEYWDGKEYEKGKGYKQFKRWEWFWKPRVDALGNFPEPGTVWKEYERFKKEQGHHRINKSNAEWEPIGPSSLSFVSSSPGIGRVNCMAEDPTDPSILYAGTPGGGLWKSFNTGSSWLPMTDHLPTLGISGIAIDPTNPDVIYITTGDGDGGDTYSVGVLKSSDGGITWNTTGLAYQTVNSLVSHKVLLSPADHNTLFVASEDGLWKSTDQAESWYQVIGSEIQDFEFHPTNPDIIYATGALFYRSDDGGENFGAITDGVPGSGLVAKFNVAVSENEPDWVYLLAGSDFDNGFLGLYRSTDAGETFTLRSDSPNVLGWSENGSDEGGQAWYDLALEIDPDNASRVFVGGVNLWRSNNGGSSWSIRAHWVYPSSTGTYVHADIHRLQYQGNRLYCGSDGGLFRSTNDGTSFQDITEGIYNTQYYRLGVSATDPGMILGGSQDNGTIQYIDGQRGQIYGGDGMECLVDPNNSDRFFVSLYYGSINRTTNGGQSFNNWTNGIPETGPWVTPYMLDPNDSNTLYAGFSSLWKRTGSGSWQQLGSPSGHIVAIDIAPTNSDVIYVSRGPGSAALSRSTDGGQSWSNLSLGIPALTPTSIAINPNDENEVVVCLSGFSVGNKVLRTIDGGESWQNISINLPNFPANTVIFDENFSDGLYLGMDVGVYYTNDDLTTWLPYNEGLPNVVINELEIQESTGKLRAATYGRGLWQTDLFSGVDSAPIADFIADRAVICEGEEVEFTDYSVLGAPGWNWNLEGGEPTTSEEQSPVVVYNTEGSFDVSLAVENAIGSDEEIKTDYITVLSGTGQELPFVDDFESVSSLNESENWFINNINSDITFEILNGIGFGSDQCLYLNNYNNTLDRRDELISNTIDMSEVEAAEISFDVAFAQQTEDDKDKLRVYVSTDCGQSWTLKKSFSGHTSLNSTDPTAEPFVPTQDQWKSLVVNNLNANNLVEGFRFKFYFENDGGNNIYIDNVNIVELTTGLAELDEEQLSMELIPNPSDFETTLRFETVDQHQVLIEIYDLTGRKVFIEQLGQLSPGQHQLLLPTVELSKGIYEVILDLSGKRSQQKLMVR